MKTNDKEALWSQKYRPQDIDSCILPKHIKDTFLNIVESGFVPSLLLHGSSGIGKTTSGRALCDTLGLEYLFVNASKDGGIDTLRGDLVSFASSLSFEGSRKVIFLDEAENLNATSTQLALRGCMETYSSNVTFILTCNSIHKILPAIQSRCTVIDFTIPDAEKPALAKQFLKRIKDILNNEGVSYENSVLVALIKRYFPDFRRTLNELQRHAIGNQLQISALGQLSDTPIDDLMTAMTERDFVSVRKWVALNSNNDAQKIMKQVFDSAHDYYSSTSIPDLVLLVGRYLYQSAFCPFQDINLMAFCVECMQTLELK